MASDEELRLGRLVVKERLATQEQVLDALRERNGDPRGPDLAEVLSRRGHVKPAELSRLRAAAARGEGAKAPQRADASTDNAISLGGVREVLARDQLEAALAEVSRDPSSALRELRRLAREFQDTESGVRAAREARSLETRRPELGRS